MHKKEKKIGGITVLFLFFVLSHYFACIEYMCARLQYLHDCWCMMYASCEHMLCHTKTLPTAAYPHKRDYLLPKLSQCLSTQTYDLEYSCCHQVYRHIRVMCIASLQQAKVTIISQHRQSVQKRFIFCQL